MASGYVIDPDANLDFGVDWTAWLGTDTITSSAWTVTGATKGVDTHDTTSTTVWLSGAVYPGQVKATNHVVTAGGRADDRTLVIQVRQR